MPVEVTASVDLVPEGTTAIATAVSAASDVYEATVNWNAPLAAAMAPVAMDFGVSVAPTMAVLQQNQLERLKMMHEEMEIDHDDNIQKPTIPLLTPKQIWQKIKNVTSGDLLHEIRNAIEDKINQVYADIADQVARIADGEVFGQLISDISSCQTPQLDTLFPDTNLDLGLFMCDYKQMYNDMKDQVKEISDKGWGGSFKINGHDASDVIKDPSLLKDSLHLATPGQGHALVGDFLSKEATNYSLQASVDAAALGKQMATLVDQKKRNLTFKKRSMLDALDDTIKMGALSSKAQVATTSATNSILATQTELQKMGINREEQLREKQEHVTALQGIWDYLNNQ